MTPMLAILSIVLASYNPHRARVVTTKANLRLLEMAVTQFAETCGRLPTAEEGLDVLVHKPNDWPDDVVRTPFLETTDLPIDGWGNKFIYVLSPESANGFSIYPHDFSNVASLMSNGPNDSSTPDPIAAWQAYFSYREKQETMQPLIAKELIVCLLVAAVAVLLWSAAGTRTESVQ